MKALAIGLGLTVVAGVGWYLVSADEPRDARGSDPVVADAPKDRGRAEASSRARDRGRAEVEPRRDGTLEQRVARLEDEVATLRRQLALRGRVGLSGRGADVEAIVEDPVLDRQVREIVEDEREAERERRDERRAEQIEQFREEALDELVVLARLTPQQRDRIDELWASETERLIPLITAARSGERSFREVREEVQSIREKTDGAAREMLSEDQFEHYDELRPRGPERRGRGGDRRGSGGPARGG
ncbi:MAG: hypothetical protein AAGF11_35845 [Myxococcota bacterium]